jgi:hypothetical protein
MWTTFMFYYSDKVQLIVACFLAIILIQMPIWLLCMDNADNMLEYIEPMCIEAHLELHV